MEQKLKLGILRETKTPPDRRVAITPAIAGKIIKTYSNVQVVAQPSDHRCFDRIEYLDNGILLDENLWDSDVLFGVKEVKIDALIPEKTYLFFAHVAKKQPYNRELLREILKRRITLIDYEYLTYPDGNRVVAFGRWAGIVGAYNGLRAKGIRSDRFNLPPAHECVDKEQLFEKLSQIKLRPVKIAITGSGRVAHGALETFDALKIKHVSPEDFLTKTYAEAVLCVIEPQDYVVRKDGLPFELNHFFKNPTEYKSNFLRFAKVADMYVPCHFWHPQSPVFFTKEDMKLPDFKIRLIADVSCDIDGPIPSTIRPSKIADPFYAIDRFTCQETNDLRHPDSILVMAVDNLPGELPRDASAEFGNTLFEKVLPSLVGEDIDKIIERATITKEGHLTPRFEYLQAYVEGKE